MRRSALFLSPHLDDVAFSCGGTLMRVIEAGWDVQLCTVFTASVGSPQGFALACQLDKGLTADIDYMALRRAEDLEFARLAGVADLRHLNYKEAPHRGYGCARELFAGVREDDLVWREIAAELPSGFNQVFAPQGLGNHADHLQMIQAVVEAGLAPDTIWYSDTPYAIRNPRALPSALLPSPLQPLSVPVDCARKAQCCRAYRTQVPFQFGSNEKMGVKLEQFHRVAGGYAEVFLTNSKSDVSFV